MAKKTTAKNAARAGARTATAKVLPMPRLTAAELMEQNTVLVSVEFGRLGNHRKGDMSEVQTEADKTMLRLTKSLITSASLSAIEKHDRETHDWLRDPRTGVALPSFFRTGIYRASFEAVPKVHQYLTRRQVERAKLVEDFVAIYPKAVAAARVDLGPQFREQDYLPAEQVAAEFTIDWSFMEVGTPGKLAKISGALEEAAEGARALLRATAHQMASRMVERLTPDVDQKKKVFKNTLVEKMQAFLDNFDLRNVTDDRELDAVLRRIRQLLKGVDPESLREDDSLRSSILQQLAPAAAALEQMVEKTSRRTILVED